MLADPTWTRGRQYDDTIDVETGTVIWMASMSDRGGPKTPIIGVGETHTLGELSQAMSKEMISKMQGRKK